MKIKHFVVDACVLTDIFIETRERHFLANQLNKVLTKKKIKPLVPIHAAFEVKCAIENERIQRPKVNYKDKDPFNKNRIEHIWLDRKFFEEYWNLSVPYIKAGDRYYILIAKKRNIPLVTEDKKQKKVAKQAGVEAFTIQEFLEKIEGSKK